MYEVMRLSDQEYVDMYASVAKDLSKKNDDEAKRIERIERIERAEREAAAAAEEKKAS